MVYVLPNRSGAKTARLLLSARLSPAAIVMDDDRRKKFLTQREVIPGPSADVVPENAEVRDRVRHSEAITPANTPWGNHVHVFALNLGDAQLS
jgi:hypothetical protein